MPPPKAITRGKAGVPAPGRFDDRQLTELSQASATSFISLDERVTALEDVTAPSRVMPPDEFTRLWWPLDEVDESKYRNQGLDRDPGEVLVGGATCVPTYGGILWDACARLYGTDATRYARGAANMTMGSPTAFSISCWMKFSNFNANNAISFGYLTSGGSAIALLYADSNRLLRFNIYTAAGTREVPAQLDMKVHEGQWHFLCGTYTGTSLAVYVDGVGTSNGYAYSAMDWTSLAGPRQWYVGFPASVNSGFGQIADLRAHNIARPGVWVHEAWRRGMGLYP